MAVDSSAATSSCLSQTMKKEIQLASMQTAKQYAYATGIDVMVAPSDAISSN
jgi:hypothetical protein